MGEIADAIIDDITSDPEFWANRYEARCHVPVMFKFNVVRILNESERAWQIQFNNGTIHWMPKSQCKITDRRKKKKIHVPGWLLTKIGKRISDDPNDK